MADKDDNKQGLLGNMANMAKEQAKEKAKSEIKKKILAKLLPALPYILLAIVIIVLVGSVFDIFLDIGKRVSEGIKGVWQNFVSLFQDSNNSDFNISDEMVLQFIEELEKATNIDFDSLKLAGDIDYSDPNLQDEIQKAKIKYVKEFLKSQLITQELRRPKLKNAKVIARHVKDGQPSDSGIQMEYVEDMDALIANAQGTSADLSNYFSVNEENGNMIIAEYTEVSINDGPPTRTYSKREIDYKELISPYSTPAQFFIYLGEIVQNPNFLLEFANLIIEDQKDGSTNGKLTTEIDFTIFETKQTTVEEEWYSYTLVTTVMKTTYDSNGDGIDDIPKDEPPLKYVDKEESYHEEYTKTKTVNEVAQYGVTFANTWKAEQTMPYIFEEDGPNITTKVTGEGNVPAIPDESAGSSYKVGQVRKTVTSITSQQYVELPVEDYIYKAGEKPDEHPEYTSFVDLLDKEFKMPNSTRKVAAGGNFRSGAEWFFRLLAQDDQTKESELFMKYVLNRYTHGQQYGNITWEDVISSGIYSDYMVDVGSGGGSSGGGSGGGSSGGGSGDSGTVVSGNDIDVHDSSLFVTDVNKIKEVINNCYSGTKRQNLLSAANEFMQIQNQYSVNAIFGIAVALRESNAGTDWEAIESYTYNWMSVTAGQYAGKVFHKEGSDYSWRWYDSFGEATLDFGRYISSSSDHYYKAGRYTVRGIVISYNRNHQDWADDVIAFMRNMYSSIGMTI